MFALVLILIKRDLWAGRIKLRSVIEFFGYSFAEEVLKADIYTDEQKSKQWKRKVR